MNLRRSILWILVAMSLSACVAAPKIYEKPIADYQAGIEFTSTSIAPYFSELNNQIRLERLYAALRDDTAWSSNALEESIASNQIEIRLQTIQLITEHAKLMGSLSESENRKQIDALSVSLGESGTSLLTTIENTTSNGIPNLFAPISQIVGLVGGIQSDQIQTSAIESAVLKTEAPILEIINLLESDLETAIASRRITLASREASMIQLFNDSVSSSPDVTLKDKMAMADELLAMRNDRDQLERVVSSKLFSKMRKAHQELVRFVKSEKTPQDVGQLADRINTFTNTAKRVDQIVQSFKTT